MPDTPLDPATPLPDDPDIPPTPGDAAFDARLAGLDGDAALADLVAARSGRTDTDADRALWTLAEARRTADPAFAERLAALEQRAAALAPGDPVARFRRLAAAHPMPGAAEKAPGAEVRPVGTAERQAARAPSARGHRARPRWHAGVFAALVVLAGAVVVLRVARPRVLDPRDVAAPDVVRGAPALPDDAEAVYRRAATQLADAERAVLGIHLGTDDRALAAAQAGLDSVMALEPPATALHLDARYLSGVACQLADNPDCAREAFAAVVAAEGPKAAQARTALARLAP